MLFFNPTNLTTANLDSNSLTLTTNPSSQVTLLDRFANALTQSGISNISQVAAQSAIKGDSFSQALKV